MYFLADILAFLPDNYQGGSGKWVDLQEKIFLSEDKKVGNISEIIESAMRSKILGTMSVGQGVIVHIKQIRVM